MSSPCPSLRDLSASDVDGEDGEEGEKEEEEEEEEAGEEVAEGEAVPSLVAVDIDAGDVALELGDWYAE